MHAVEQEGCFSPPRAVVAGVSVGHACSLLVPSCQCVLHLLAPKQTPATHGMNRVNMLTLLPCLQRAVSDKRIAVSTCTISMGLDAVSRCPCVSRGHLGALHRHTHPRCRAPWHGGGMPHFHASCYVQAAVSATCQKMEPRTAYPYGACCTAAKSICMLPYRFGVQAL